MSENKLAFLDENNVVKNVIVATSEFDSNGIDVTGTKVSKGWLYDRENDTFQPPKPSNKKSRKVLDIAINKTKADVGATVTASASIKMSNDDSLVDVNEDYYIPIMDIDGSKKDILELNFNGGEANTDFSIDEKGIYTINVEEIRPKVSTKNIQNPELIIS
jgi:hypothetical protein